MITKLVFALFLISTLLTPAQWQQEWQSPSTVSTFNSGWIAIEQSGTGENYKFFKIDENSLMIMDSYYSSTVLYQYNFTQPEILGGYMIYSLEVDLTGDNIFEFYVLSYYGTAEPYRQSFKILDITNGQILFEQNNTSYYYSYPTVWDVDDDGILECSFAVWDYPTFANYSYEIYNTEISTSVVLDNAIQNKFGLMQNYPNPFNPSTTIEFYIEKSQQVKLDIYDVLGRRVSNVLDKSIQPGRHSIEFNANELSSGNYFYQLKAGENTETKKMSIIK